jgi:hypothetical protein
MKTLPTQANIQRFETHGAAVAIALSQTRAIPSWLLLILLLVVVKEDTMFIHNDPFLVQTVPGFNDTLAKWPPYREGQSLMTGDSINDGYVRAVLRDLLNWEVSSTLSDPLLDFLIFLSSSLRQRRI